MINIFINSAGNMPSTLSFGIPSVTGSEMSPASFKKVMRFLKDNYDDGISISGGEPLTHSHIKEILGVIKVTNNLNSIFFNTSGTLLSKLVDEFIEMSQIKEFVSICLYYKKSELLKDLPVTIDLLRKNNIKVELGVEVLNISGQSFRDLFKFAEETSIKVLRWEITIPKRENLPSDFYLSVKDNLMSLMRLCVEHRITPYTSCNHIPYCFFNSDELRVLSYISNDNFGGPKCDNYINFHPNNYASGCVALNSIENNLNFDSIDFSVLKDILKIKSEAFMEQNLMIECKNCPYRGLLVKRCGCMGF